MKKQGEAIYELTTDVEALKAAVNFDGVARDRFDAAKEKARSEGAVAYQTSMTLLTRRFVQLSGRG